MKMSMRKWEGSKGDKKADAYEGKMHKEGSKRDEAEDRAAVKAINKGKSGVKAHIAMHRKYREE